VAVNNDHLQATAFLNTDDTIAMVVMNETDQKESFKVGYNNSFVDVELEAHSIVTYLFQK
jgi:glucosylceramidase